MGKVKTGVILAVCVVVIAGLFIGCAKIPDVTYNYYPAKWESTVTVTQTVGCTADNKRPVVLNTASVATEYSSDTDEEKLLKLKIKDLQNISADIDMAMTYTDDGRLKSINQSTTGQGETIIKSAVTLATAVGAKQIYIKPKSDISEETITKACGEINNWGGNKPVTLTYRASIDKNSLTKKKVPLEITSESEGLYKLIRDILPELTVTAVYNNALLSGPSYGRQSDSEVKLELQKIGSVDITIDSSTSDQPVGSSRIVVPLEEKYQLPIPKAALFGKQSFTLELSEAGAVKSIGYGKDVGTSGALNAISSILEDQSEETDDANLKAKADLIKQQQRLVLCKTQPKECH